MDKLSVLHVSRYVHVWTWQKRAEMKYPGLFSRRQLTCKALCRVLVTFVVACRWEWRARGGKYEEGTEEEDEEEEGGGVRRRTGKKKGGATRNDRGDSEKKNRREKRRE